MSNAIFPVLPGLAFDVVKTPNFSTTIQRSRSGRELRRSNWSSPLVKFSLNYEFLRDESVFDELKLLAGFYMQRQGSFDSFLFADPDDGFVSNYQFGVGDGVTTQFQLSRNFGGNIEAVHHIDLVNFLIGSRMWAHDATTPMWSSTPTTPMWSKAKTYVAPSYTISTKGVVTFATPPALNEPLIWNGGFYYRCRFDADSMDFNKFMERLWNLGTCDLLGDLGGRI